MNAIKISLTLSLCLYGTASYAVSTITCPPGSQEHEGQCWSPNPSHPNPPTTPTEIINGAIGVGTGIGIGTGIGHGGQGGQGGAGGQGGNATGGSATGGNASAGYAAKAWSDTVAAQTPTANKPINYDNPSLITDLRGLGDIEVLRREAASQGRMPGSGGFSGALTDARIPMGQGVEGGFWLTFQDAAKAIQSMGNIIAAERQALGQTRPPRRPLPGAIPTVANPAAGPEFYSVPAGPAMPSKAQLEAGVRQNAMVTDVSKLLELMPSANDELARQLDLSLKAVALTPQ